MIRFGVIRREDFSGSPGFVSRVLHGPRVSYRLLSATQPPRAGDAAIFDHILYHLRLGDGIYTSTFPGRFDKFNLWCTNQLASAFPDTPKLLVEEWGASDATTSAEWFPVLRTAFPDARLVASDRTVHLIEAVLEDGTAYIFDQDGHPLQYVASPMVVRLPDDAAPFVINRWIASRAMERLRRLTGVSGIDTAALRFDADGLASCPPLTCRRLSLRHPAARALAAAQVGFELDEHSAFDPSTRGPHVIRTMNVLNLDYFSRKRLGDAAAAVWASLPIGGLWIVGRTVHDPQRIHHASVLRKNADGFSVLEHHGQPSEVEPIALQVVRGSVS
jgi:hypothetical protein